MNKQESYQVLALLQANYPDAFRGMSEDAAKTKIGLWADIFADEPFDLVVMAAKAYMATDTKGFMPTVSGLRFMSWTALANGAQREATTRT